MNDAAQLTDFQYLMRSWKTLAPYNAAHVLHVSGAADAARWRRALSDAIAPIGIRDVRVEWSDADIDRTIASELNRPFEHAQSPLRAVLIPAGSGHFIVLTYDHWFADSPSIRAFLHRAFERYRGTSAELPPLRQSSRTGRRSAFRAIANGIRTYRRHRRAARIYLHDSLNFETGFFSRHFAPATITAIRARARQHHAKVNDVFIAAAAHVLGKHTEGQRAASRRNEIAIASAVDLRDAEAASTFGFDVSYFSVVLANPEQIAFDDLVRTVAKQTSTMKTDDEVTRFELSLQCARFACRLTSKPKRRAELFRKGLPLVAGISNVNLSGTWADTAAASGDEPRLLDYLRVSPVGPLLPLVFTLTTIGDRLSLCISFRKTAFTNDVAAQLVETFMHKLIAFGKTAV